MPKRASLHDDRLVDSPSSSSAVHRSDSTTAYCTVLARRACLVRYRLPPTVSAGLWLGRCAGRVWRRGRGPSQLPSSSLLSALHPRSARPAPSPRRLAQRRLTRVSQRCLPSKLTALQPPQLRARLAHSSSSPPSVSFRSLHNTIPTRLFHAYREPAAFLLCGRRSVAAHTNQQHEYRRRRRC